MRLHSLFRDLYPVADTNPVNITKIFVVFVICINSITDFLYVIDVVFAVMYVCTQTYYTTFIMNDVGGSQNS